MFPPNLLTSLKSTRIVAVVVLDAVEHAAPLGRALRAGGIRAVELTLRTPAAVEALQVMQREVPELIVGAGTVLSVRQVEEVMAAGAAFGVAPGTNGAVLAAAKSAGLPFAPGVMTPSDIEAALDAGCRLMKFFPAEPAGGLALLRAIAAPYAHLGVSFIPLGGLSEANFTRYLAEPLVAAVGGSWVAPRELIAAEAWEEISQRAKDAMDKVREAERK